MARIFNNSWGQAVWARYYNPINAPHDTPRSDVAVEAIDSDLDALLSHALDHPESVMVFAAGNDGQNSPSLTENDGMGTRLHLDAATFHSLRSSLGARLVTEETPFDAHTVWKGYLSAAWNHELLDKAGTAHASFASVPGTGFSNTVKVPGRDSLGLGAGVSFTTDANVSFSLTAGSELFRRGGTSLYGNVAVGWTF